eukprot:3083122-Rhodomonas_salina.1
MPGATGGAPSLPSGIGNSPSSESWEGVSEIRPKIHQPNVDTAPCSDNPPLPVSLPLTPPAHLHTCQGGRVHRGARCYQRGVQKPRQFPS